MGRQRTGYSAACPAHTHPPTCDELLVGYIQGHGKDHEAVGLTHRVHWLQRQLAGLQAGGTRTAATQRSMGTQVGGNTQRKRKRQGREWWDARGQVQMGVLTAAAAAAAGSATMPHMAPLMYSTS